MTAGNISMDAPPGERDRRTGFGRFFLPGPTEVRPAVLGAQAQPMIGHRGAAMNALMDRLEAGLKPVFRTQRPVYVSTSSATGLFEAAARCGIAERALCCPPTMWKWLWSM